MDSKIIILVLLSAGAILGSMYIYLKKGNESFSVSILAAFLLFLGLIFFETFVLNYFGPTNPHPLIVFLSYMFFVFCLLLAPTFYLYILSLVKKKEEIFNLNKAQFLYGPAVLLFSVNIYSFVALYNIDPESSNYIMIETIFRYFNFISLFFIFLLQNIYFIFSAAKVYRRERVILQESQSKESNRTLKWMKAFILLYLVLIILLYLFQLKPLLPGKAAFRIFTLVYIGILIYYGSNNYQFIIENIKGKTLDGQKILEIKAKLLAFMENEKPYLDNSISLSGLAQSIETNNKYLSYLINKEFGCNFSSFINDYRIEEAKKLLSNPDNNIYTIESIAEKTGFKSKSAFNSAFKKNTKLTPSKFKLAYS